jgi:hypothetical protein
MRFAELPASQEAIKASLTRMNANDLCELLINGADSITLAKDRGDEAAELSARGQVLCDLAREKINIEFPGQHARRLLNAHCESLLDAVRQKARKAVGVALTDRRTQKATKTELRLAEHRSVPGEKVIEVWFEGQFIGEVTGSDGPGVRIISKHPLTGNHKAGLPEVLEVTIATPGLA